MGDPASGIDESPYPTTVDSHSIDMCQDPKANAQPSRKPKQSQQKYRTTAPASFEHDLAGIGSIVVVKPDEFNPKDAPSLHAVGEPLDLVHYKEKDEPWAPIAGSKRKRGAVEESAAFEARYKGKVTVLHKAPAPYVPVVSRSGTWPLERRYNQAYSIIKTGSHIDDSVQAATPSSSDSVLTDCNEEYEAILKNRKCELPVTVSLDHKSVGLETIGFCDEMADVSIISKEFADEIKCKPRRLSPDERKALPRDVHKRKLNSIGISEINLTWVEPSQTLGRARIPVHVVPGALTQLLISYAAATKHDMWPVARSIVYQNPSLPRIVAPVRFPHLSKQARRSQQPQIDAKEAQHQAEADQRQARLLAELRAQPLSSSTMQPPMGSMVPSNQATGNMQAPALIATSGNVTPTTAPGSTSAKLSANVASAAGNGGSTNTTAMEPPLLPRSSTCAGTATSVSAVSASSSTHTLASASSGLQVPGSPSPLAALVIKSAPATPVQSSPSTAPSTVSAVSGLVSVQGGTPSNVSPISTAPTVGSDTTTPSGAAAIIKP